MIPTGITNLHHNFHILYPFISKALVAVVAKKQG